MASTDVNRDSVPPPAGNPPPLRFGLKSIFVLIAIVAALSAGASAGGLFGFLVAAIGVSILVWIWARLTRRRRLGDIFSRISVYGSLVAILVAMMPTVGGPRESGRRSACLNNLKQLEMALFQYEAKHHALPPVFTADKNDKPLMSWRTAILPLIEQGKLFSQYHADEPWDSADNNSVTTNQLRIYQCPADIGSSDYNKATSYVAIVGPGTAWQPDHATKLSEITDPLADTILLVEMKDTGIAWAEPRDLDLNNLPPGITNQNLIHSLCNHAGCFNAVFADAHTESVPETISWSDFLALLTIAGGETVDRSKW
jgi:Protein of unknown function (DUF1559)